MYIILSCILYINVNENSRLHIIGDRPKSKKSIFSSSNFLPKTFLVLNNTRDNTYSTNSIQKINGIFYGIRWKYVYAIIEGKIALQKSGIRKYMHMFRYPSKNIIRRKIRKEITRKKNDVKTK